MKPSKDRLLIEFLDVRKSDTGIIRPETWKVYKAAKVLAKGKNVEDVEVGDIVYIRRFTVVEIKRKDFIFTHKDNIIFKNKKGCSKPHYIYHIKSGRHDRYGN